jgi:hypothetical protein
VLVVYPLSMVVKNSGRSSCRGTASTAARQLLRETVPEPGRFLVDPGRCHRIGHRGSFHGIDECGSHGQPDRRIHPGPLPAGKAAQVVGVVTSTITT